MLNYSQKAAWLAKRRFFTRIAKENQNTLFPTLIDSDNRVKASLTNSILHRSTPPLDPLNDEVDKTSQRTPIHVVKFDSFDCAEILRQEGKQHIVVLNMASSTSPGGGYLSGAGAQEEALCRRSTLYLTIRRQRNFHPIPPHGGIYSPHVLILRTNDDTQCALLPVENRWWTSVISVAGIKKPRLTPSEEDFAREADREDTRERIRTILRIAALQERKNLVLGSLGCGAYGNPPKAVAECFKRVLQEDEFKNRFEGIWFAVIERGGTQNYTIFKEALDGLEI